MEAGGRKSASQQLDRRNFDRSRGHASSYRWYFKKIFLFVLCFIVNVIILLQIFLIFVYTSSSKFKLF